LSHTPSTVNLETFKAQSKNKSKENKLFLEKLRKRKPGDLDHVTLDLHQKAFTHIDCLDCANCCKTTSPIVIDRDIDRLARRLKMKPSQVVNDYLTLDEDGDYVFTQAPCPFLMPDNYCMVYEDRPRACREYPHTDRKRFHQILNLTYKNTLVCPAVLEVVDGLKENYSQ
jgi:Fe-S-cluster containining protein